MAHIKAMPTNTNEIVLTDEETLNHGSMKRWKKCPSYCVCEKVCNCENYKKMTKKQIRDLQMHLKELYKVAEE